MALIYVCSVSDLILYSIHGNFILIWVINHFDTASSLPRDFCSVVCWLITRNYSLRGQELTLNDISPTLNPFLLPIMSGKVQSRSQIKSSQVSVLHPAVIFLPGRTKFIACYIIDLSYDPLRLVLLFLSVILAVPVLVESG